MKSENEKINKVFLITIFSLLVCLIGLLVIYFFSRENRNLFLALPNELSSPRISVNIIEDFSENEFPLTYEITSPDRLSLAQGDYAVTLIGTNSSYPFIMGLPMLEGSFFTKQAWNGKLKHAVLNETAAFAIFGSSRIVNNRFRLRNDTWIVCGVIQDGDEDNSNVYIPSSVWGGEAAAFALATTARLDETYAKNSLKNANIRDGLFKFINFDVFSRLFRERFLTIPLLFVGFLLLSFLNPLIMLFRIRLSVLKKNLSQHYVKEILKNHQKSLVHIAFPIMGLVFSPALAIFLLIQLVSMWLPWQDIPSLAGLNKDLFYPHLSRLINLETFSFCLFIFSLAVLAIFFVGLNLQINKSLIAKKSFPK